MKTCTKCHVKKPLGEFSKMTRARDGLQCKCKSCAKEYRRENIDAVNEKDRRYYADNRDRLRKSYHENRDIRLARMKRYRDANKDKAAEYSKAYRAEKPDVQRRLNHKYRSLKRGAVQGNYIPTYTEFINFYGTNCIIPDCDSPDTSYDHVIPLSKGGAHGLWNLQPLCRNHNIQKSNIHSTDYRTFIWLDRYPEFGDVMYTPYPKVTLEE